MLLAAKSYPSDLANVATQARASVTSGVSAGALTTESSNE